MESWRFDDRRARANEHWPRRPDGLAAQVSLIAEIEAQLKTAMRARDELRTSTLRLVLNALRIAEKDGQRPLEPDEELQILRRERKRRLEAVEAYRDAGRTEQAAREEAELALIEELMPAQLGDDELEQLVGEAITAVGATAPGDLGRVMSEVMPKVAGRADGTRVRSLVGARLG